MEQQDNRIHFRKTLHFKMIMVLLFLGIIFLGALLCIYEMSCRRFEEELTYHSDTLTEQICRNVDVSLKELSEDTVPLTLTNERFGPLLIQMEDGDGRNGLFLRARVHYYLDEILSMNDDINWVAVIDSCEEAYLARRVSMPAGSVPVKTELTKLYLENEENLGARPGNTVWISSTNPEGIILMRSIFDFYTMRFCGCIMAEVQDTSIREIFNDIDSTKIGYFTIYDRNGEPLYSTSPAQAEEAYDGNNGTEKRGSILQTEYPISRVKLKLVHVVDLKEKNRRFSDLLYLISVVGVFAFGAAILLLWLLFGKMAKKLKVLLENLHRISRGEFELEPVLFARGDELDVLALSIQEMSVRIKGLMEQVVKNQELQQKNRYALLEARYHELQAQVNPHFLFNILQSINGIAQINGDKQVSRLICMLSKFFRGNVDRRNTSCELSEELEYAENYMELYREIYPDRLNIRWEVDDAFMRVRIPTYILQPIVENSLVHGMEPMIGTCTIRISVYEEEDKLVISVWDNGGGIDPDKLCELKEGKGVSKRVGIRNVQDRIRMFYGEEYGLSIDSEYHHYTEVRIMLPLL
ncbi:cache domain-containing sensor histidine kinase [Lacrimispora sp. 210928-DFI.3.58]|uniref:cache domain-containing sensor histidine kinase n=1 Tax=Lacrimispora sp. 210928-DFI.3.58 TaxID=2883214 RepID=UPI001D0919DF|nr:histidine kinase [Lacrimispora sp. 210928-DFI.3.58]MCB7320072.1 sensor histidine kinase [Lacrimispora sp. 210928-DFI.3.58]